MFDNSGDVVKQFLDHGTVRVHEESLSLADQRDEAIGLESGIADARVPDGDRGRYSVDQKATACGGAHR